MKTIDEQLEDALARARQLEADVQAGSRANLPLLPQIARDGRFEIELREVHGFRHSIGNWPLRRNSPIESLWLRRDRRGA